MEMSNYNTDNVWLKNKLPFVRIPISFSTVIHAVPISTIEELSSHVCKLFKATGNRCEYTGQYEYKFIKWDTV